MSAPALLLFALLGAALGSFAALAAERSLRGGPILTGRSACRSCGTRLRARELVPLLSWPWLRGRCAHCGARIPAALWQAEIAGAAMGLAAGWTAPDAGRGLLALCWMAALLALAIADLRRFRLPDPLMAVAALLGLALAMAGDGTGWPDLATRAGMALWGALAGAGSFWLIREGYRRLAGREGMGLGDVLLMGTIGLALGAARLPWVVLLAAGAMLALALLRARRRGRPVRRLGALPFGAALAMAALAVWLAGV